MKRAKMFVVFLVMVSMMLSNYTGLQHVHAEEAEEESIEETAEETEELSSEVEDGNSNTEIEWVDEPAEFSEPAAYTISDNWNYQIVNGILTIRGTGSIDDFSYNNLPPWYSRRSEIDWVEMQNGITRIGAFAFYGLTNVTRVTLSKNLISIGAHAFDSCKGITQIVIPDGVTTLGDEDELGNGGYVFANSGLTSISLPDSITNIENGCFMNCKDLASVSLPSHLTAVKKDLFSGCSNLTSVYIPSSVTTIELAAFYECTSLTTVAVGSSVTELGRRVFQDCTQLSEVILPKGIETIGQWAFDACTSLRTVKYGGTQTDWSNITIADGNTPCMMMD